MQTCLVLSLFPALCAQLHSCDEKFLLVILSTIHPSDSLTLGRAWPLGYGEDLQLGSRCSLYGVAFGDVLSGSRLLPQFLLGMTVVQSREQ